VFSLLLARQTQSRQPQPETPEPWVSPPFSTSITLTLTSDERQINDWSHFTRHDITLCGT
jgi:hypothetical protein